MSETDGVRIICFDGCDFASAINTRRRVDMMCLPDEVLQRIFLFCFPSVGPTYTESVRSIGRLMRACRRCDALFRVCWGL